MNNYKDSYGRFHHKPVTVANPIPSNNSWLFTAYAEKVGVPVDKQALGNCFNLCRVDDKTHLRSPGQVDPPISRDEILGMVALGLFKPKIGTALSWNFSPRELPQFSPLKLIKQLWQLRPSYELLPWDGDVTNPHKEALVWQHRNYFWQNNLDQLYRFAFSVPIVDRHFILQKWGKFNVLYWAIAKVDSIIGTNSGIRFLKYGKSKEAMVKEFPADHPIVKAVNET